VSTVPHLQAAIRAADLGIPEDNVIAEPVKRNTAGCLVYAAATLLARSGLEPDQITVAVLTADQRIPDTQVFLDTVRSACDAAEGHHALVTIGIQPSRPDTGFGYIETAENAEPVSGFSGRHPLYPVVRFHEKPSEDEAARYLDTGRFFWNSGMFFWRLSSFLSEFEHANPVFAQTARSVARAMQQQKTSEANELFAALPSTSIDYALMEGARNVLVVPGRFAWDDLGAWDALDRSFPQDHHGNVTVGDPVLIDSEDCIVYNAPGAAKIEVAAVGLDNVVIVVAEDAVLVVRKDQAQKVKQAVAELKRRGSSRI
jgi:mannose-1-phosphate guanylyltransferase